MSSELVLPDPRQASVPQLISACQSLEQRIRDDPPQDVGQAVDLLDKIVAIEGYLAKRDAGWAAQTPARLLEAHIGKLLGPAISGANQHTGAVPREVHLERNRAHEFRDLNEYRQAWESKLPLSRRAALREVEMMRRPPAAGIDLPTNRYGLIYADPPWSMPSGVADRGLERHYPVMTTEAISAIDVASVTATNAVLFMWAISTHLHEAFHVMEAWGFDYKSSMVWVKDRPGTGWWVRQQHEYLLIGTHGEVSPPQPHQRPRSVIEAPRVDHSAKPVIVAEMLEALWPGVPRLEMFSRAPRDGWDAIGDEAA